MSDDQTLFLNNDDVTLVARIANIVCVRHGLDAKTSLAISEEIAQMLGKAEARSFKGKAGRIFKTNALKFWSTAILAFFGAITTLLLWVFDIINIGG